MSRIGNLAIKLPAGITCTFSESAGKVSVKGSKGELSQDIKPGFKVQINDGTVQVTRPSDEKISQKSRETSKPKAAWKTRWEADSAYKAWREAQVPKGTVISDEQKAKFADLQADAFRCRDKIRREEGLKTEATAQAAGGAGADE